MAEQGQEQPWGRRLRLLSVRGRVKDLDLGKGMEGVAMAGGYFGVENPVS